MGSILSANMSSDDEETQHGNANGSFLLRENDRQNFMRQLEHLAASQEEADRPPLVAPDVRPSAQLLTRPNNTTVSLLQTSQPEYQAPPTCRMVVESSSSSTDTWSDHGGYDGDMYGYPMRWYSVSQSFTISEKEPYKTCYDKFHEDTRQRCGSIEVEAPTSILSAVHTRELCSNLVNRHFLNSTNQIRRSGFTTAERVYLRNSFFPNRRRSVDSVHAKTFCVCYLNDGNGLMTASQDHKIRLYGKCGPRRRYFLERALTVPYVGWSILDVAVSPDGRDLVYSTWNTSMYQCNLKDKEPNWLPLRIDASTARFALFSIRFNRDGTEIMGGSTDQNMYIYNRETSSCVLSVKVHDDDVNAVCFGDEGSHILLSGGDDGLVKAWDRRTMNAFGRARPVGIFAGHRDGITFIDSRRDDRYFLSNSKDQTIKVWDLRHFATETGIQSTRQSVCKQQWDYRWQCSPQENLYMRPIAGDCSLLTLRGHSVLHTLVRARFSPEHTGRRYIYSGCGRGNCVVYDLITGKTKVVFEGHRSVVRDVDWNPNDSEIVATSWDGETSLWCYDERYEVPSESNTER